MTNVWAFGWQSMKGVESGTINHSGGTVVLGIEAGLSKEEWARAIDEVVEYTKKENDLEYVHISFIAKLTSGAEGEQA